MKRSVAILGFLFTVLMSVFCLNPVQAQRVQVPSGCTVVVAGVGGNVINGIVGDGGIVVMPDPYAGGTFSWIAPVSFQVKKWTLLGDISLVPSGFQILNSSFVSIKSFNKDIRLPENIPNFQLARSKGRVRVDYKNPPCEGTMTFDIYKTYPDGQPTRQYVPPIVGPDCWEPGDRITYSVDPVASDNMNDAIGVDQYYWEVRTPANNPNTVPLYYFSGERSSITFDVPTNASCDWEIKCWFGRANLWDQGMAMTYALPLHPTKSTKSGRVKPSAPQFSLNQPLPTCLDANISSFTAAVVPACTTLRYSWTAPYNPGVQVTMSGSQQEIVTVSNLDANPVTLILAVADDLGACDARTFIYTINRSFSPPMALTSTPNPLCLHPGDPFTLSLPPNAMNNYTTWQPQGWLQSQTPYNNALGSSANFLVPSNTLGGTYTIEAEATLCPGTLAVDVCVIPENVTINGPDCIDYGTNTTLQYSVIAPGPGIFDFNWRVPAGWTISSTNNTNNTSTIQVVSNGLNLCPLEVDICCDGTNCCGTMTKDLNFNPVMPSIVANQTCYVAGQVATAEFHVQNPVPGTYHWTVDPQFGTIVSSQDLPGICGKPIIAHSITVQYHLSQVVTPIPNGLSASFNTLNVPLAVQVYHETPCGISGVDFEPVSIGSGYSLQSTNNGANGFSYLTIVPIPSNGTQFQWIEDCNTSNPLPCTACGNVFVSNPMTHLPGRHYGVVITAPNGCVTVLCLPTDYSYRLPNPSDKPLKDGLGHPDPGDIMLLPNPNDGAFELRVPEVHRNGTLTVYDATGQRIFSETLRAGNNRYSKNMLAAGMYFLYIELEGKVSVKRMEVIH